ncbi:ribbon-helix-helix domain-containing protein [Pseudomonas gingeri]|uniref:ribbon-helix-helix domain-containing protein n=1 Tax=Pseudomonas gingeri TaxID=117681 RepID=UPI0015A113EC|nr:ribbon-helix-helix domain-containing protein [Pseudomonas gingeri]NWA11935.1 hypothetical protein [Pseudomonas gingeri]
MAGLKGLAKTSTDEKAQRTEDAALAFIGSASLVAPKPTEPAPEKKKKPAAKSKRVNFSLDDSIDKQIDKLSMMPRNFKASRSDVIRAGVQLLLSMPRADVIAKLREVVGADEDTHEEQDQ